MTGTDVALLRGSNVGTAIGDAVTTRNLATMTKIRSLLSPKA